MRFGSENDTGRAEAVFVANGVTPELVKIPQSIRGHLKQKLPGTYLVKEAIHINFMAQAYPRGYPDASVANSFEDVEVSQTVAKPQNDGNMIKMRVGKGPCEP